MVQSQCCKKCCLAWNKNDILYTLPPPVFAKYLQGMPKGILFGWILLKSDDSIIKGAQKGMKSLTESVFFGLSVCIYKIHYKSKQLSVIPTLSIEIKKQIISKWWFMKTGYCMNSSSQLSRLIQTWGVGSSSTGGLFCPLIFRR